MILYHTMPVMIYLFHISQMKYLTCMRLWCISDMEKIDKSVVQEICDKIANNN